MAVVLQRRILRSPVNALSWPSSRNLTRRRIYVTWHYKSGEVKQEQFYRRCKTCLPKDTRSTNRLPAFVNHLRRFNHRSMVLWFSKERLNNNSPASILNKTYTRSDLYNHTRITKVYLQQQNGSTHT